MIETYDLESSPDSRSHIIAGVGLIAVLVGGIGGWAAFAHIQGAVIAPAVVTVGSYRKTVQHREGGIIRALLVREGDHVEAGQLLIKLDDTDQRARLAELDTQVAALRGREARLFAEQSVAPGIAFPPDLVFKATQDAGVLAILEGERTLFTARAATRDGEIGVLRNRIAGFGEDIRSVAAEERTSRNQLALIRDELSGLQMLYEKGYAPRTRLLALEREAERLGGEIEAHRSEANHARAAIDEAQLQIAQVEKIFQQKANEELREVQTELALKTEQRAAVWDELQRTEIRSPQGGRVVGLVHHTLGGVIAPGQTILDVVPSADELVFEAHIRPEDIDKVRQGQDAFVRLSAFDRRKTPEVAATVDLVSADRLTSSDGNSSYFLTRVRVSPEELARLKDVVLVPGMPAEVFIKTREQTALQYLLKPIEDSLSRALRD